MVSGECAMTERTLALIVGSAESIYMRTANQAQSQRMMRAAVVTEEVESQGIIAGERVSFKVSLSYPPVSSHGHDY